MSTPSSRCSSRNQVQVGARGIHSMYSCHSWLRGRSHRLLHRLRRDLKESCGTQVSRCPGIDTYGNTHIAIQSSRHGFPVQHGSQRIWLGVPSKTRCLVAGCAIDRRVLPFQKKTLSMLKPLSWSNPSCQSRQAGP